MDPRGQMRPGPCTIKPPDGSLKANLPLKASGASSGAAAGATPGAISGTAPGTSAIPGGPGGGQYGRSDVAAQARKCRDSQRERDATIWAAVARVGGCALRSKWQSQPGAGRAAGGKGGEGPAAGDGTAAVGAAAGAAVAPATWAILAALLPSPCPTVSHAASRAGLTCRSTSLAEAAQRHSASSARNATCRLAASPLAVGAEWGMRVEWGMGAESGTQGARPAAATAAAECSSTAFSSVAHAIGAVTPAPGTPGHVKGRTAHAPANPAWHVDSEPCTPSATSSLPIPCTPPTPCAPHPARKPPTPCTPPIPCTLSPAHIPIAANARASTARASTIPCLSWSLPPTTALATAPAARRAVVACWAAPAREAAAAVAREAAAAAARSPAPGTGEAAPPPVHEPPPPPVHTTRPSAVQTHTTRCAEIAPCSVRKRSSSNSSPAAARAFSHTGATAAHTGRGGRAEPWSADTGRGATCALTAAACTAPVDVAAPAMPLSHSSAPEVLPSAPVASTRPRRPEASLPGGSTRSNTHKCRRAPASIRACATERAPLADGVNGGNVHGSTAAVNGGGVNGSFRGANSVRPAVVGRTAVASLRREGADGGLSVAKLGVGWAGETASR
eukprot:scaffold19395_cov81-Isochrysis_galbana.AAC.1